MHVHCLHWLISTGLLLQSTFSDHVNPRLVKCCQWRVLIWHGDLILFPLSANICLGLVMECLPFVGACGCHSHSKLYHCVILLLCFSLCHHPSHPHSLSTHLLVYTAQILMNSMKKSFKIVKIGYCLLARLVI